MYTEAIKHLREWGNGNLETLDDPDFGICWNLDTLLPSGIWGYALVVQASKDWPKHSGNSSYPISENFGENLWQNPDRLELCLFIADKLAELDNAN